MGRLGGGGGGGFGGRLRSLGGVRVGLLTLRFDAATWTFSKIDMGHGAYREEKNI